MWHEMFAPFYAVIASFILFIGLLQQTTCQLNTDVCDSDDIECKRPNILGNFGTIKTGKRSNGFILIRKQRTSILGCIKECFITSQCKAINYRQIWKLCELIGNNASPDNTVDDKECLYSELSSWPKTLAGKCEDHICSAGEKCQKSQNGTSVECVKAYCEKAVPSTDHAILVEKFGLSRDLLTVFKFKCEESFITIGKPFLLCNQDGNWKKLFCCVRKDYPHLSLIGKYPRDCHAIPAYCGDGVYKISPRQTISFEVYCLMRNKDSGRNWHVIQHRKTGSISFKRSWKEYEDGFGDMGNYGDFWLGNKKIHYLTEQGNNFLHIALDLYTNQKKGWYTHFDVGDANSKYKLTIKGYQEYNAKNTLRGNSMLYHSGCQFTTYDQDNDNNTSSNCAIEYHSGWWFNKCLHANLNGDIKLNGTYAQGIQWAALGAQYSLQTSRMMIRTT